MRRKAGTLVPLEIAIIEIAKRLKQQNGVGEFYGFQIAGEIAGEQRKSFLVGYGTLYRALSRLVTMGLLSSRWEESVSEGESRPRRRYYHLVEDAA